jgi:pyruvate/2-oxoglutarate dehydrogenase complex dihydrolipoamide acyltransferase (E2) component
MILRLETPMLDQSLMGGHVLDWAVSAGDSFGFGDLICNIEFNQFAALRRTARATKLSSRRNKSLKSSLEVREGKVSLVVAVTAADSGWVREIVAGPGADVKVGSLLAVVTTDASEPLELDGDLDSAPAVRVTPNVVDQSELGEGAF